MKKIFSFLLNVTYKLSETKNEKVSEFWGNVYQKIGNVFYNFSK